MSCEGSLYIFQFAVSVALNCAVSTQQYSTLEKTSVLKSLITCLPSFVLQVLAIMTLLCSLRVRFSDIITSRSLTLNLGSNEWFYFVLYSDPVFISLVLAWHSNWNLFSLCILLLSVARWKIWFISARRLGVSFMDATLTQIPVSFAKDDSVVVYIPVFVRYENEDGKWGDYWGLKQNFSLCSCRWFCCSLLLFGFC